jgi:hypothetical protein
MTASPRLATSCLQAELSRLGLNEWAFVRECNRAERCSVNVCPMDPLIALRATDPLDLEVRCPVSKPDRERFYSRLPSEWRALLPFGGLLEGEWRRREAARHRLASMGPEQLARMRAGREKGLAALQKARSKARSVPTAPGPAPDTPGAVSPTKAVLIGSEEA